MTKQDRLNKVAIKIAQLISFMGDYRVTIEPKNHCPGFEGIHFPDRKIIRINRCADYVTIAHEIAHAEQHLLLGRSVCWSMLANRGGKATTEQESIARQHFHIQKRWEDILVITGLAKEYQDASYSQYKYPALDKPLPVAYK